MSLSVGKRVPSWGAAAGAGGALEDAVRAAAAGCNAVGVRGVEAENVLFRYPSLPLPATLCPEKPPLEPRDE